ncbi:fyv-10 [Verticillium alfalfae VaMs.102]|uniref:Fyv-10 n=1 Tax=Verticillium alfalfae (strain VaMs.102 / ATCC MYA-4576 / FGSC 10136) TaxID=526221 RepID=C9SV04_VERA1|nr:fyv-10 [Verticillium alfalfae VaMs.102]EEY22619.1 fyv-10 [Verticillium alfalfae VaMs.102]
MSLQPQAPRALHEPPSTETSTPPPSTPDPTDVWPLGKSHPSCRKPDQPLLRLPYELLRNNFRAAHFTVEKESTSIKALLKDTATASVNGRASPDQVLQNLDAMIAKMRGVKRKLTTYADEEARLYHQTDARIAHLGELYGMHSFDDVKYETWSRSRRRPDVCLDEQDPGVITSGQRCRKRLLGAKTTRRSCARKILEFMLRFQQYVELLRSHKYLEAIAHSKKYIVPYKSVYPDQCRKAFGLLAYSNADAAANTTYATLYSPDRWNNLVDIFTNNHNELLALPRLPLLHIALSSGLSALKTPACHSSSAVASFTTTVPFSPEQYIETNAGISQSSSNETQRWRQPQQQQDHGMHSEPSGDGAHSQNPHHHHHHHQQQARQPPSRAPPRPAPSAPPSSTTSRATSRTPTTPKVTSTRTSCCCRTATPLARTASRTMRASPGSSPRLRSRTSRRGRRIMPRS